MCNAITESQATMFLKPLSPLTSMLPAVMTLHSTLNTEVTVRDAEYVLSYTLSLYDSEFHLFNPKDNLNFKSNRVPLFTLPWMLTYNAISFGPILLHDTHLTVQLVGEV